MMMTDDENSVMAFVDGELDDAARAAFEARLRDDASLRQRVEREQRLREMLGATYAPVLEEPVPAAVSAALRPKVVALDKARERRRWTWAHWGGMAASIALGLVIGRQMVLPVESAGGTNLQASGVLAQALDTKLSGEQLGGVALGLSFAAKGGGYCRSFTMQGSAGLACKEGAGWQLRQLSPIGPQGSAEFRTAATALPPALLAAVDEMREGDVLDAKGEAQALARGWRK